MQTRNFHFRYVYYIFSTKTIFQPVLEHDELEFPIHRPSESHHDVVTRVETRKQKVLSFEINTAVHNTLHGKS